MTISNIAGQEAVDGSTYAYSLTSFTRLKNDGTLK